VRILGFQGSSSRLTVLLVNGGQILDGRPGLISLATAMSTCGAASRQESEVRLQFNLLILFLAF
jgi:hypothetical protein